jgi:Icc protein
VALLGPLVEPAGGAETGPPLDGRVTTAGGAGSSSVTRAELTTVADDEIVVHVRPGGGDRGGTGGAARAVSLTGLTPGAEYEVEGMRARTLGRPGGELLTRFATVNDVHFGEQVCGAIAGMGDLAAFVAASGLDQSQVDAAVERVTSAFGQLGTTPVLTSADMPIPEEPTYPELMSAAAAAEIAACSPEVVLAKGDLTGEGTEDEYRAFLRCYQGAFGDRLVHVRGNHDAMAGEVIAAEPRWVDLPGAALAVLDTVIEGSDTGQLSAAQLEWLDDLAAGADRPVLVFGHHHPWNPGSRRRSPGYFGINPDDSEALVALVARRPRVLGYFAGHTHRNRVRRFSATGDVPYAEVASVKDFPGSWAEYRVFEGGVLQVHRRISSPAALAWSELCRSLYWGLYPGYAFGRLEDRCFAVLPRPA